MGLPGAAGDHQSAKPGSRGCLSAFTSNLEGIQLLFWLLKDLFWCCMFAPFSFGFGVPAASMQWLFLYLDWKYTSARFHNFALAMWLTGNFFWMVGETTFEPADDHGAKQALNLSNCPVFEDGNEQVYVTLRDTATVMFTIAISCLLVFYLFFRGSYRRELEAEHAALGMASDSYAEGDKGKADHAMLESVVPCGCVSRERGLVAYDNVHIIFWVCKDLFWSLKDSPQIMPTAMVSALAAASSVLTMLVGTHVAYIAYKYTMMRAYRDGTTLVFWVTGNAVWMFGELWAEDGFRVYAAVSFCIGLCTHVYALANYDRDMVIQAEVYGRSH